MLLDEASASVKLANLKDSFNHTANATFARLRSFSDPHHRLAGTSFFQHEEDEGPEDNVMDRVNDDVIFASCSFLSPADLISFGTTCKRVQGIALCCQLWRELCLARWSLDAASPAGRALMESSSSDVNFVQLYSLIEDYPLGFNCSAADVDASAAFHGELIQSATALSRRPKTALEVEYTGGVGLGNRCVRTDLPFPSTRNWERRSYAALSATRRNSVGSGPVAFLHRLMKLATQGGGAAMGAAAAAAAAAIMSADASNVEADAASAPLPFSTPVMLRSAVESGELCVDVAPRLMSYFEVTIAPPAAGQPHDVPDCIAVGLSAEPFTLRGKMPGWDLHSYGYHSDDGGAFHNAGSMLYKYGPSFGPGDVVGCGLDHTQGAGVAADIFFTLNGKYLGVAFTAVHAGALYPTVGLDSTAPVRINLGASPFQFDLAAHGVERAAAADVARAIASAAAVEHRAAEARARHTAALQFCPFLFGAAAIPALARAYEASG